MMCEVERFPTGIQDIGRKYIDSPRRQKVRTRVCFCLYNIEQSLENSGLQMHVPSTHSPTSKR